MVLLDYLMPGMNGDELALHLREQRPDLPLVVVSAVGQLPQSLLNMIDANVQKGQSPEVLLSTVAAILDECNGGKDMHVRMEPEQTILYVEDEELQLKARRILLESAGFRVVGAQSAHEALEAFRSSRIDAVVVDYWLSGRGGNGTALAEEIKKINPRIPIIMLSAFGSLPGESMVVDSWMRKGETEPEELVNEVRRLIEFRNPRQDTEIE